MGRSYIPGLIFLYCFFVPLPAQVTIFPKVDHMDRNTHIEVMRVVLKSNFTIIDLIYHPAQVNTDMGEWACIDRTTFITPSGREERKYLVMAKGISICPRMTKILMNPEKPYTFHLYFPPLEKKVLKIDIIGKNMNFRGVSLSNPAQYPPADSAPYHNQEAFIRYFTEHKDLLDPLEGLWRLQVRRQNYLSNGTYPEETSIPPQVVAILKEGERFATYDDTGLNRREYFKKLSGKKGYFFWTIFPEVEGESSAYTYFSDPDRFYLKYTLPDRLAHYYLPDQYVPGMKVMEIAEYQRIPLTLEERGTPVIDLGKDTIRIKKPPTNY